jgi:hypothetical protein
VTDSVTIEAELDSVPLLEWLDDDSENEKFTIVQSRKKKKKQVKLCLECLVEEPPIRKSKRLTRSLYRKVGGQEPPHPGMKSKRKKK